MNWWETYRAYAEPSAIGLLIGWTMVQLFKTSRRDRRLPKAGNATHRMVAMLSASLGTWVATLLGDLPETRAIALAVITGLLCPTAWGAAMALTREKKGWMGQLHWYLRGNRRVRDAPVATHRRAEDDGDPEDTWY